MRRTAVRLLQQVETAGGAPFTLRRFTSIPVIDISSLVKPAEEQSDGDTEQQIQAGQKLHKAAKNVGFFYVENTGLASVGPLLIFWAAISHQIQA